MLHHVLQLLCPCHLGPQLYAVVEVQSALCHAVPSALARSVTTYLSTGGTLSSPMVGVTTSTLLLSLPPVASPTVTTSVISMPSTTHIPPVGPPGGPNLPESVVVSSSSMAMDLTSVVSAIPVGGCVPAAAVPHSFTSPAVAHSPMTSGAPVSAVFSVPSLGAATTSTVMYAGLPRVTPVDPLTAAEFGSLQPFAYSLVPPNIPNYHGGDQ